MNRRSLLVGSAGVITSTVSVLGSSAFTTVDADRTIEIDVADDNEGLLALSQRGSGRRSYEDGTPETLGFDLPSPDEDDYGGTDPDGLGTDSVYRFGEDAAHDESGLFGVKNQGTQPVKVFSTQETTAGVPSVTMYDVETGNLLTESSPSGPLGVGEQIVCGLEIDTHGVPVQEDEYDLTLTINAVATD
jgi:hypothetical protein